MLRSFNSNHLKVLSILIFFLFSLYASVNGQKLKKYEKELAKERLENIKLKIDYNEYEIAMSILSANKNLFENPNLPKKLKKIYNNISKSLVPYKLKFENNKRIVNQYKRFYEQKAYYAAIRIFDLEINNYNSYLESRELAEDLKKKLKDIKVKCEEYRKKVSYVKVYFRIKDWESIFEIYESVIRTDGEYISREETEKFLILMKMITSHYGFYQYNRDKNVKPLELFLDSINRIDVNLSNAEKLISKLNNKYVIYDTIRLSEFPQLEAKYNDLINLKEKKIKSIRNIILLEKRKTRKSAVSKKNIAKSRKSKTNKITSKRSKFVLTHMLGKKIPTPAYFFIGSQKVWVLDFNNGDKIKYTIKSFRKDNHFRGIRAVDNFGDVVIIDIIKTGGNNTVIEIRYDAGTIKYSGYYQK